MILGSIKNNTKLISYTKLYQIEKMGSEFNFRWLEELITSKSNKASSISHDAQVGIYQIITNLKQTENRWSP